MSNSKIISKLLPMIGASLASVVFSPSYAQDTGVVEEIVVSAQRRDQNLQSVPISVTAFTEDTIAALGLKQSSDIAAQTPNFSIGYPNGESGVPAMFIRGVGVSDYRVFTPAAIAPYADEVYLAQSAGQIFQLLDMERIEVLRGPQGTLYGRNATGGAINYIAKKPSDDYQGDLSVTAAEFGYTSVSAAFGGPISDTLGFRVAATKTDSDGWLKNNLTGNDQGGADEAAYRALLNWAPSDSVNALFNIHGGSTKSDVVQYRHLGLLDASGDACSLSDIQALLCVDAFGYSEYQPFTSADGTVIPAASAYDEGSYDLEAKEDTGFWGTSLKLEVDIGDLLFTSITAYDYLDDFRPEEVDASPNDVLTGRYKVEQKTFSQELRFSQQRSGWNWQGGAYYLDDEAKSGGGFRVLGLLRPFFVGVDDPAICASDDGIAPPPGNPNGFCPGQNVSTSKSGTVQTIESLSFYGDASIDLSDTFKINVGLRYTDEKVSHDVLALYDEPLLATNVILDAEAKTSFDNVSGRAVFDWQASDNVLLYGGVSTGFKAGGIDSTNDGQVNYDSEELINYEAGFKSTLANQSVRFNGSVFLYDYTDLQVFTFVNVGFETFSVLSNASDADVFGTELELQWFPTENTFVNLGLGYLDSEYKDFVDIITGDDFSGNQILMSPDLTYNGLIQHDFQFGSMGTLTAQVDFSFQDDVFFDAQNSPLISQSSYTLYNARLAWRAPNSDLEVAVWGRNLGDKEYLVYAFDLAFLGFNEEMLGAPRSFGLDVTFGF